MHFTPLKLSEKGALLAIIIWAVFLKALFSFTLPTPITAPDTYGYNLVGYNMLRGTTPTFNDERTPAYPLLLNTMMRVAGRNDNRLDSQEFIQGAKLIASVQSIISILSIVLFFAITKLLALPRTLRYIITTIYASNIFIFFWERVLLTESFAISWMIATTLALLHTIARKPKTFTLVFILLLSLFGFLLRPVFVLLPLVTYPVLLLAQKDTKIRKRIIVMLLVYLCIPVFYIANNVRNFNYSGINHITDVNILGRIIKDDIPIDAASNNRFYQSYTSFISSPKTKDPYMYLYFHDPSLLIRQNNREEMNDLKTFTATVMRNNIPSYVLGALKDVVPALIESPAAISNIPSHTPYSALWSTLISIFQLLQKLNILILVCIPIVIIKAIRKPQTSTLLILILAVTTLYLVSVTTLFGYSDFGRLLIPIYPLSILLIAWCGWSMLGGQRKST